MNSEDEKPDNIQLLPYDIILLILEYTSISDIVSFGSTCKQFNDLIQSTPGLWKLKLRHAINARAYGEIAKNSDVNWYNEVKKYSNLQTEIHNAVIDMAAYYYRCNSEIPLYDMKQFFKSTYSNGLSYYCSIDILQELIRKGPKGTIIRNTNKPFTLTETYYSKVALRHFLHPYLSIKWVQNHLNRDHKPEHVLNFFVQWVDPLKMHTDEEVDEALNSMAKMVEAQLKKVCSSQSSTGSIYEMCKKGEISELHIISAVSHVMYKEKRMTPVSMANLETLDIIQVIKMRCGHDVVIAAIYQALARRFGVRCELIAFPNHLFLELRSKQANNHVYKIQLDTGALVIKRNCPFSRHDGDPSNYTYCPDALLQFVITAFLTPMGSYKTWHMQNAIYLLDFLSRNPNSDNKYKTYLPYLFENAHLPVLSIPISVNCLTDEQLKIITLLSYLTQSPPPYKKEEVVKRRAGNIHYAVGMVMQHTEYDYLGVVRAWEHGGGPAAVPPPRPLRPGPSQPFYVVVAIDQTERYVAQEYLQAVPRPTRLHHLEDIISREFTHFNGFAYEPNVHKRAEYPDDAAVAEQYRVRAANLFGSEPT